MLRTFDSEAIAAASYDPETAELRVRFTTGRLYAYNDVPPPVAEDLFAADSQGGYFNAHIRDRFDYREVTGEGL